jgi:hypothetical protein
MQYPGYLKIKVSIYLSRNNKKNYICDLLKNRSSNEQKN